MSILPPEVHAALTQLLQGLSSADNDARAFAEEQLNTAWVATQPDVLLMGLVELLGVAQEQSVSKRGQQRIISLLECINHADMH